MIVLVGETIHCYDDPILLFWHQMMYLTHTIQTFSIISISHSNIKDYLISINKHSSQRGDYLAGKLGPEELRNVMCPGKKLGPTWALNIQRWAQNNNSTTGMLSRCPSLTLARVQATEPSLIPIMNTKGDDLRRLMKTWSTLKDIRRYFKLPRELCIVPFKKIKRVLRSCVKYGKVTTGCYIGMGDIYWVFEHLILNDSQYDQLKTLIDELYEMDILFPFEQVCTILVEYELYISKLRTSRFLKDSLPDSDFARYCLLVKNHIFSTIPRTRKDINMFWKEVWEHWGSLTPDERNRKMLNSLGAIRSWADDEEMKLFIGSSESDEEIVQWCPIKECNNDDDDDADDDDDDDYDENNGDEADDSFYWNGWNTNIDPSKSDLALIKEVDDETICESNHTIIKPEEHLTDNENACNPQDSDDITSTPVTKDNHIDRHEDSDSTKDTDLSLTKTYSFDFNKPGALTALLDSPSSCGSSNTGERHFSGVDIEIDGDENDLPHIPHHEELSLPEKIEKYEKLSGIIKPSRNFSIHRRGSPSSPLSINSFEGVELDHDFNSIDLMPTSKTAESNVNSLKTSLKPVMKRASTTSVFELKRLVDLRPVNAGSGNTSPSMSPSSSTSKMMNTSRKLDLKNDISKRSISSIFAALLDDNMRDLATSAEYRNKIVHPEDLYNRLKISSDKPWDKLSKKTKERYYSAFSRRYSNRLDHPEDFMHVKTSKDKDALEVEDVVELVRVCASFDDWKRPIFKYALQLVDSVESSTDNSEIDE